MNNHSLTFQMYYISILFFFLFNILMFSELNNNRLFYQQSPDERKSPEKNQGELTMRDCERQLVGEETQVHTYILAREGLHFSSSAPPLIAAHGHAPEVFIKFRRSLFLLSGLYLLVYYVCYSLCSIMNEIIGSIRLESKLLENI